MTIPVSDYTSLLSGYSWHSWIYTSKPIVLTYSFSQTSPYYMTEEKPEYVNTFAELNNWEQNVVRDALSSWSAVAGITFIETAKIGDLNFSFVDMDAIGVGQDVAAGLGQYPSSYVFRDSADKLNAYTGEYRSSGDVWFGTAYRASGGYADDLISVALHEIGHALGLKHPHDISGTYDHILEPDTFGSTVMSYQYRAHELGPIDVAAAQYLYGPAGAAGDWIWNPAAQQFTFTGTTASEVIRGTALDDIVYGYGGYDIIVTSMGNDRIYVGSGEAMIKAGDGVDIAHSQASLEKASNLTGSGDWNYRYLPSEGVFQGFESVEFIHFADGLIDTARSIFVTKDTFSQFEAAQRLLVRMEAEHAALETAATNGQSASAFVAELLNGAAKDSTIPALMAYKAMLGSAPGAAKMDGLAHFVHGQIFSPGYQATNDPRLGGFEAMGLALAEISAAIASSATKGNAAFASESYSKIFGREAGTLQVSHFVAQIDYFEQLYLGAGISLDTASTKARGAMYGQMLGHAAKEDSNPFLVEAKEVLTGYLKADTGGGWLV
jgi:hypothetical protein